MKNQNSNPLPGLLLGALLITIGSSISIYVYTVEPWALAAVMIGFIATAFLIK